MARAKRERPPDPDRLVRRSAGDLHTEDGRFEVSSTGGAGRWYVTDTERHDGLGLALVLGPFGTLDEARGAIAAQREAPTGDDGPLPDAEPGPPRARRRPTKRGAADQPPPAPEPAPEPEPEPVPVSPPVTITRPPWRRRGDERDEVIEVVVGFQDALLHDEPEAGSDALHRSVVCLLPGAVGRSEGPEAVVAALRGYLSVGTLDAFRAHDLGVDVAGATAVVTQRHELVRRESTGDHASVVGRDLLVLARDHGRWLVTWCMVLSGQDA